MQGIAQDAMFLLPQSMEYLNMFGGNWKPNNIMSNYFNGENTMLMGLYKLNIGLD